MKSGLKIEKIWISKTPGFPDEIRVDFNNDRHYAAVISWPCSQIDIADALAEMARMIATDRELA